MFADQNKRGFLFFMKLFTFSCKTWYKMWYNSHYIRNKYDWGKLVWNYFLFAYAWSNSWWVVLRCHLSKPSLTFKNRKRSTKFSAVIGSNAFIRRNWRDKSNNRLVPYMKMFIWWAQENNFSWALANEKCFPKRTR